jgi:hypothetical protein
MISKATLNELKGPTPRGCPLQQFLYLILLSTGINIQYAA